MPHYTSKGRYKVPIKKGATTDQPKDDNEVIKTIYSILQEGRIKTKARLLKEDNLKKRSRFFSATTGFLLATLTVLLAMLCMKTELQEARELFQRGLNKINRILEVIEKQDGDQPHATQTSTDSTQILGLSQQINTASGSTATSVENQRSTTNPATNRQALPTATQTTNGDSHTNHYTDLAGNRITETAKGNAITGRITTFAAPKIAISQFGSINPPKFNSNNLLLKRSATTVPKAPAGPKQHHPKASYPPAASHTQTSSTSTSSSSSQRQSNSASSSSSQRPPKIPKLQTQLTDDIVDISDEEFGRFHGDNWFYQQQADDFPTPGLNSEDE